MDNLSRAFTEEEQILVVEILTLSFAVHCKTKYCVFIDFSGHVDSLEIHITPSQTDYNTRLLETECYTAYKKIDIEKKLPLESHIPWLEAKRDILLRVLEEESVNVEGVKKISREVYDLYF